MPQQKTYYDYEGNVIPPKKQYYDYAGQPIDSPVQTPSEIINKVTPKPVIDLAKTITSNLPSAKTLSEVGAGTAIGTALGMPPVGLAATIALQKLNDPSSTDKTPWENIKEMGLDFVLQELMGKGFSAAGLVGKEIIKPGSVLPAQMNKLLPFKPTTGQLSGNKFLQLIENTFAAKKKQLATEASARIIDQRAEKLLSDFTGRSDIVITKPFEQGANVQQSIESSFDALKSESTQRGSEAKLIGQANKTKVPVYVANTDALTGVPTGGAKFTGYRDVTGEVLPTNYLAEVHKILDEFARSDKIPDPDSAIIKDLKNALSKNQAIDKNGLPTANSRNFADLWETKKAFGAEAFENPKTKIDHTNRLYTRLYNAIDKDIQASLPSWKINSDAALNFYNESKIIAHKRYDLFEAKSVERLVNEETGAVPAIDAVIKDPKILRKAMLTGVITVPEGQGSNFTKIKYLTTNTRQDLAGYEFTQIVNNAKYIDKATGATLYDGHKLLESLKDPNKQESYKMLWSAQNRADIEQFFTNASQVAQKDSTGMSHYWLMRLTSTGVGLSASLLAGMGTIPTATVGIVSGTIALNKVAKLLTNPSTARLIVAAAQGGPLNMPARVAGRAIANVLRNTPITLEYTDGNKVNVTLNSTGKFVIDLTSPAP